MIKNLLMKRYKSPLFFVSACVLILLPLSTAFSVVSMDEENIYSSLQPISIEQAEQIVDAFLKQKNKQNDFCTNTFQVIKHSDISLCYLFDLDPMGYIAISCFKELPAVVAYSFTTQTDNSFVSDVTFKDIISADLSNRLLSLDSTDETIKDKHLKQWQVLSSNSHKQNTTFNQWPSDGTTLTEGWIETQWHQQSPYNDFCPLDPNSGERGIAGCPAIAIGQILHFHTTINNVFFDDRDDYFHNFGNRFRIDDDFEEYDFPSFPSLNIYLDSVKEHYAQQIPLTDEDVASLVFGCGVAATQVYSPQVSGTFGVQQAYDAYMKFNCSTAQLIKDDTQEIYQRIQENMKEVLPVHLAVVTPEMDAGHNLIIDGYNTDGYYHLNFGWGGNYDGWYLLPEELPYELTVFEGVIVDICKPLTNADLSTEGSISFSKQTPGSIVNTSFTVLNKGEPTSKLQWEITSYPDWGNWIFTPMQGGDLTPEDGPVVVSVSIELPSEKNLNIDGYVYLTNTDDTNDQSSIPISITTAKHQCSIMHLLSHRFPFFEWLSQLITC